MSRYKYSKTEQEFNNVLKHQSDELNRIKFPDVGSLDTNIKQSEGMLQELGIELPTQPSCPSKDAREKATVVIPTWEHLCEKAQKDLKYNASLENLFTENELSRNQQIIRELNKEYKEIYHLDHSDIAICIFAGLLSALVDILMIGIPQKTPTGLKGGPLENYVRDYFDKKFPEEDMKELANSKVSKVPFDAQDNRNTMVYVEGLSAYYHRLLSLGHDPVLGFIFGIADIMTGSMTTIDKKGKIVRQVMENYADRKESDVFAALAKQIIHFKSDITTSMGLPAPMMSLFNLLQFGSIGEEEQTIADIVQGMYFEGYDFIHFCSLSIPVMITEVTVRIGYAVKRIKEGYSVKESIPFSKNRENLPKLGTMLFIGHTVATAINAGKVYFTKNPMAINYPQWIAFAIYSYQQLKWVLVTKPEAQDSYVMNEISAEMKDVLESVDNTFTDISRNYVFVIE